MISEKTIQNDLKGLIRSNIDAYLKIQETARNATCMSVRQVLCNTAFKRAELIRNLSTAFHTYNNDESFESNKLAINAEGELVLNTVQQISAA